MENDNRVKAESLGRSSHFDALRNRRHRRVVSAQGEEEGTIQIPMEAEGGGEADGHMRWTRRKTFCAIMQTISPTSAQVIKTSAAQGRKVHFCCSDASELTPGIHLRAGRGAPQSLTSAR
ncbi:hypothetical protein HPP92_018157 [Vanilla planifolia]|uniref:Uncharacterized protein n=1 Tax=Vanilla planifolia TaxID=51239 RepID=A0A835QAL3_VANPL|nr:hypothetical protein HPP92_018157 [Vanilla planifolia]